MTVDLPVLSGNEGVGEELLVVDGIPPPPVLEAAGEGVPSDSVTLIAPFSYHVIVFLILFVVTKSRSPSPSISAVIKSPTYESTTT